MHGEDDHLSTSLNDGAADDLLGFSRAISGQLSASLDGMNDVHAFADCAEDGVITVEPGCSDGGQEKLRPTRVSSGIGHGKDAGLVVLEGEGRSFAGNLPARSTGTGSPRHGVLGMRAAALDHEIFNDTV